MSKVNVKPVLLNGEQIQALKTIQERERQKSGMGIAPSIHAVARKIFDAGLSKWRQGNELLNQNWETQHRADGLCR